MKKIEMILKTGKHIEFDTIPELMEYICEYKLLSQINTEKYLVALWNCATEKFAIESEQIESIIIRDIYYVDVRHQQSYTFHTREQFEDFMASVGATRGHILTGARYGIYGGEIVTRRYDCYISGVLPYWKDQWD